MGAQITDSKTITADIWRCIERDKNEMASTVRLYST